MAKKSDPAIFKSISELTDFGFVIIPLEKKVPILKKWNQIKKTPEHRYLFEKHNIGALTGEVSGITLLDIDIKDDGMKQWKCLSSAYPEIHTPMVKSASGGIHIYFRYNNKLHSFSRFKLNGKYVGWDLLNNDRQAVVPPSKIGSRRYSWVVSLHEAKLASMPKWLEDYLLLCKSFK